ncbi:hypothetical protein LINPERPRIM_LOCUS30089 [Linum perenne]
MIQSSLEKLWKKKLTESYRISTLMAS